MKKLLINTATDDLFIVLKKDNENFSVSINSKMHHNETMLPEIDRLLSDHNVEINSIDELGVVIGPGSFTGIRVGVSTIKAFRDAIGIKAKGINNLDYLFALAREKDFEIETVAINGGKNAAYLALQIMAVKHEEIKVKLLADRVSMEEAAMKANEEVKTKY